MGLGRVCDKGLVALPSGGAPRGADLQLVESVCALRGAAAPARGGDQPAAVAQCDWSGSAARRPDDGGVDQHPCGGRTRAAVADRAELVFERVEEWCGAVDFNPMLATDLGPDFGALSDFGSGQSGLVWATGSPAGLAASLAVLRSSAPPAAKRAGTRRRCRFNCRF